MALDFDLNYFPTTIDRLHAGLAVFAIIELFLLVFLLTVVVIALVRKSTATSSKASKGLKQPKAQQEAASLPPARAKQERPRAETRSVAAKPAPVILKESTPDAALQLLGLLQQEARFIDFVEEDVAAYSDADIGAAARVVHEGCHKVLNAHFDFEPVRQETENKRITLPVGFDASSVRLTGNIVGEAPFSGTLIHRGWRVTHVKLPKMAEGHNAEIVAPAEVEL